MTMRIVEQYAVFPNRCFFTGSASIEKPILDTGHHTEWDGRIYMSGEYLEEACRLLGWHSPDEVDFLTAENVSLRARFEAAQADQEELARLRESIVQAAAQMKPATPAGNIQPNAAFPHTTYNGG